MQHRKIIIALGGLLLLGSLFGWRRIVKNAVMTARIAWGEARNQGSRGLQAVINVIDNRVKVGNWMGKTHEEVATKSFQFSAYNPNDPNRAKLEAVTDDDPIYAEALVLAYEAVNDNLPDITGGATHYHSRFIHPPFWTKGATQTAVIGDHIFYKDVA